MSCRDFNPYDYLMIEVRVTDLPETTQTFNISKEWEGNEKEGIKCLLTYLDSLEMYDHMEIISIKKGGSHGF